MDESSMVRLYRLAYERAPEPILVLASHGRVLFSNRAVREKPEPWIGAAVAYLQQASARAFREDVLSGGRAWAEVEIDGTRLALDGRRHGDQLVVKVASPSSRPPRAAGGTSCGCGWL